MPWRKVSIMESREEFCELELKEGASIRALRRRLRITLGYSCYRRRTRLLRLEEDPADERAPDIFGGVLLIQLVLDLTRHCFPSLVRATTEIMVLGRGWRTRCRRRYHNCNRRTATSQAPDLPGRDEAVFRFAVDESSGAPLSQPCTWSSVHKRQGILGGRRLQTLSIDLASLAFRSCRITATLPSSRVTTTIYLSEASASMAAAPLVL